MAIVVLSVEIQILIKHRRKKMQSKKKYKVTMSIYDDNLGLEKAKDPARILRLHISDMNVSLSDFELEDVEEIDSKTEENIFYKNHINDINGKTISTMLSLIFAHWFRYDNLDAFLNGKEDFASVLRRQIILDETQEIVKKYFYLA